MASYTEKISALETQLQSARDRWSVDLITAAKAKGWDTMLTDPALVDAFVESADGLLRTKAAYDDIKADADKRRAKKRGPGRPPKSEGVAQTEVEPATDGKKAGAVSASRKDGATATAAPV